MRCEKVNLELLQNVIFLPWKSGPTKLRDSISWVVYSTKKNRFTVDFLESLLLKIPKRLSLFPEIAGQNKENQTFIY